MKEQRIVELLINLSEQYPKRTIRIMDFVGLIEATK